MPQTLIVAIAASHTLPVDDSLHRAHRHRRAVEGPWPDRSTTRNGETPPGRAADLHSVPLLGSLHVLRSRDRPSPHALPVRGDGHDDVGERRPWRAPRAEPPGGSAAERATERRRCLRSAARVAERASSNLPADFPALEMRDIEHSLCEVGKYLRIDGGEGRTRSGFDGAA